MKSSPEGFKDLLCSACDEYCANLDEYNKHKRLCTATGDFIYHLDLLDSYNIYSSLL